MNWLRASLAVAAVIVLDRITKLWALWYFGQEWFVAPFLSLKVVFNRGVSWSLFASEHTSAFVLLSLCIATFVLFYIRFTLQQARTGVWIGGELLVIAGAIGNLIDRPLYGGVVDFIALHLYFFDFPLFNVADMAIVIGAGLILIREWFVSRNRGGLSCNS